MQLTAQAPSWFRAELQQRFGSGYDCVWDETVARWAIVSPSASGRPTKQLVVWRRDPATGAPIRPNKSGLLPFRELTLDCMHEILDALERTALTNRHDGAGRWVEHGRRVMAHNDDVVRRDLADLAEASALAHRRLFPTR